eukprot:837692-Prorocentrum_minimum.AAC.3
MAVCEEEVSNVRRVDGGALTLLLLAPLDHHRGDAVGALVVRPTAEGLAILGKKVAYEDMDV